MLPVANILENVFSIAALYYNKNYRVCSNTTISYCLTKWKVPKRKQKQSTVYCILRNFRIKNI